MRRGENEPQFLDAHHFQRGMQAAIITVGWKAEREVANATAAVSWEVAQAERQNHVGPNKERKKKCST